MEDPMRFGFDVVCLIVGAGANAFTAAKCHSIVPAVVAGVALACAAFVARLPRTYLD